MSDHRAYAPLMRALEAVSISDHPTAIAALTEAESALPRRRHSSRDDIEAARRSLAEGAADMAWRHIHQALVDLSSMFPPDYSVCPPLPSVRQRQKD